MKKNVTIISLIIGIIVITVIHQIAITDLQERLSWCNTNSCYTNDATNNDECHRLLAQEPTSTCQYYYDLCNQRVDRLYADIDQCFNSAEGLGAMADEAQKEWAYWMDSSDACYTAQDEVLVFLDQAIKNMDSFYCSEVLRTDEIACNIMDARFVIVENLELMCEGCYPE